MRNVARWMIVGSLAVGCVEQPPQRRGGGNAPSQAQVDAVRRRVASTTRPSPSHPLDINFGNKVRLIGYDITPDSIRPGTEVNVTWYWSCEATTGDGWMLFTHLNDTNGPRANHDHDGEVRQAYQPQNWRRGEFITDRQTFQIPPEWDSPIVRIYMGLWKENERANFGRMQVVSGPSDNESRALAMTLNVQGVTAPPPAREASLDVPRASGPIVIDGRLDDAAWRTAATTGPLVNPANGAPPGAGDAHGNVRVLWDAQNLYLGWDVQDDNLVATGAERDAHMWTNDAVELLLDPNGDGRDYYEIQVAPNGITFDTLQPQPPTADHFGNVAWNPEMNVRVVADGTVGNEADTDRGYTVEMAIPWGQINNGAAHTPPNPGDSFRANFFLMDRPKQGGQRFAGWSPPRGGSFHIPERFGRLTFRDAPVAVVMPPAPSGPAPSANTAPTPSAGAAAPAAPPAAGAGAHAAAPGGNAEPPTPGMNGPAGTDRPVLRVAAPVQIPPTLRQAVRANPAPPEHETQ